MMEPGMEVSNCHDSGQVWIDNLLLIGQGGGCRVGGAGEGKQEGGRQELVFLRYFNQISDTETNKRDYSLFCTN